MKKLFPLLILTLLSLQGCKALENMTAEQKDSIADNVETTGTGLSVLAGPFAGLIVAGVGILGYAIRNGGLKKKDQS